jgi:hypothetical protein
MANQSDSLDTSTEAAAEQRRLFAAMTPHERVALMAEMWEDGVRLVESSLRDQGVTDPIELRVKRFRRIYASDFDAETLDRISASLAEYMRAHGAAKT